MNKDFDNWNILKKKLDNNKSITSFEQREIWWCHTGLNIGDEECGKGEKSLRPVLIIRKFNKNIFLAIPLTTKIKDNFFYKKITFKDQTRCLMISQIRILDQKRLMDKMGKIGKKQFDEVKELLKKII